MTFELTDEMIAKWPPDAQAVVRLLLVWIMDAKPAPMGIPGGHPASWGLCGGLAMCLTWKRCRSRSDR
jgi:hypothetical protein